MKLFTTWIEEYLAQVIPKVVAIVEMHSGTKFSVNNLNYDAVCVFNAACQPKVLG